MRPCRPRFRKPMACCTLASTLASTSALAMCVSKTPTRGSREQMYDVIVIGVGGMGSATVYQLARSGRRVLGVVFGNTVPPHLAPNS